jgi:hypothetical protein
MGSSASINIGKYEFLVSQSYISPLLLIYNTWDRYIETYIEDDEEIISYKYKTTVKLAKQCLDVSGYKILKTKELFETSKVEMEHYFEYNYEDNFDEALSKYNFENWYSTVINIAQKLSSKRYSWTDDEAWFKKIAKTNVCEYIITESLSLNPSSYWGFPDENIDQWNVFRVILEAFDDNENIILDYTALLEVGYCDTVQEKNEFVFDKVLILTEGVTDSEFISRSLNILYPHLDKFYHFMDFEIMKVSGGVSYLAHYIKAFAGAKINNMIIGLFDNDSAALDELRNLNGIQLPQNIKVVKLPDIEVAKSYPTIGPTDRQKIDINGFACSIELFPGKDVLQQNDGTFTPIRWTGYKERINQYQGDIINKSELHKKFRQKLDLTEKTKQINLKEWEDMVILIESIIHAFD